ncbi:rho GTPase-activating protein 12-like isoform X3 [Dreissena polymorpha]|uniref:rho GTPase-activating protein 12-like isoform X3 n=1 Tax=Dreissena polymorpha TaxID=45954 RepID=UPI00226426F6|nr:rho GTPase-activating protein 12-like isoform X3 [Dreissena polymorpha]
MAGPALNFTHDKFPRVKVLYAYQYEDDHKEQIHMEEGEIFYLLNSDSKEWFCVCRPDSPESEFYVPSAYVEVLASVRDGYLPQSKVDQSNNTGVIELRLNKEISISGQVESGSTNSKQNMDDDDDDDYMNVESHALKSNVGVSSFKGQTLETNANRPPSLDGDADDDYVNLADYREKAGLTSDGSTIPVNDSNQSKWPKLFFHRKTKSDVGDIGDYANLDEIRSHMKLPPQQEALPQLSQGRLVKPLGEDWQQFEEIKTKRPFYHNTKTGECKWKPPKGNYHQQKEKKWSSSSDDYENVTLCQASSEVAITKSSRKSRSLDLGRPRFVVESEIPQGWSFKKNDDGEEVFVNDYTQQQWIRTQDESGRNYFYRFSEEITHTSWQLPRQVGGQSPTGSLSPESPDPNKTFFPQNVSTAEQKFANLFAPPSQSRVNRPPHQRHNTFSMILETGSGNGPATVMTGPPPPKSATLPKSFSTQDFSAPVHLDTIQDGRRESNESINSLHNCVNINETVEGMLNKCKIAIGKKPSKKWASQYAKLDGSNLVFYKDKKASIPTKQDVHGKVEQMVCLVNCSVSKDSFDKTSKKNTIVLSNPEGHLLLQADSETSMQEWFIKIHTRIGELGGTPDSPDTPISDSGTLERKGKIKKSLESWISKRSDKKTLENKGIYKENMFGGEIKQICAKEKSKVPTFVTKCVEAIEKRGLEHEGIYRIAGSMSQIQKLRCTVDQGEQYNLDDQMWDVHVLCGTLKLFFRELKDPLFTYALFDKFLKGFLSEKAAERFKQIKSVMDELPRHNYDTIKALFKHFCNVMDLQKENKMAAHQLAIVFGPTLIWPDPQTTSMQLATSLVYQSQIVEFVLLEYKNIFR